MAEDGSQLLEQLMRFKPDGLTPNAWAVQAGVGRTIWADLRRHGNPSRRTLEKLLSVAGSSLAEFEALRVGAASAALNGDRPLLGDPGRGWAGPALGPIPLLHTSLEGEWMSLGSGIELHAIDPSTVVGQAERPRALAADREAYAVTISGDSMWPRFRNDRQLLVSPAAPVAAGDDVLVELRAGGVLIKELVGQSATRLELRQFQPDVAFVVEMSLVATVHKIMGEAL